MTMLKITFLSLFLLTVSAWAQDTSVKVNTGASSEDTTISVKKGTVTDRKYEITEGQDELSGDPAPLQNTARANWQKACNEWKKELKELNPSNQILTMNCGSPDCVTSTMQTQCKSMSKHKIRVQIN